MCGNNVMALARVQQVSSVCVDLQVKALACQAYTRLTQQRVAQALHYNRFAVDDTK